MSKMQYVEMYLSNAHNSKQKGDVLWTGRHIEGALMKLLSIAVEEHADHATVVKWLLNKGVHSLLRRYHKNLVEIIGEVDAGRLPCSTFGGNYPHVVYAHLSWALQDFPMGESFIAIAERKDSAGISTPFWCEYARGMGSLVRGEPYQMRKMRLRDLEQYWVEYLPLIEAVTNGRPVNEALERVDQAFAKRNSDKRIKDDGDETEGSGRHPVKWDYRRDSLLGYIRRSQG